MISVIVPVYNVEKYLKQCVESILAQTYKDLEIILVDDGSEDTCPQICDQFAEQDSRIKVIHKKNGGLMSAWKTGVLQSRGEYLGFVDSDDWIDPDMYERLYSKMKQYHSDMALCGWIREMADGQEKENIFLKEEYYDRAKMESEIFPRMISFGKMFERWVSPNRVTKLFRRELILNNLKYCDERISVGEDMVVSFSCMFDAQSICVLPDYFPYHYRMNELSIMRKPDFKFYDKALLLNQQMNVILQSKNMTGFEVQLHNDLLSLAFWGMERIVQADVEKREKMKYIANVLKSQEFKEALRKETLTKCNKKCKIYKGFVKLHWKWGLYMFISKVVMKKRELFGY